MIYLYAPNQIIGKIYEQKLLKGSPNEEVKIFTNYESMLGLDIKMMFLAPGWNMGEEPKRVMQRLMSRDCVLFELQHVFG